MDSHEKIKERYYTDTAARYESMHVHEGDEHHVAMKYIENFAAMLEIKSVLDVGCGTGWALRHFLKSGMAAKGVEPVQALIDVAVGSGVPEGLIVRTRAEAMPFADGSFDAVCAFGVLHHVRDPNVVVREMTRVASKAVFISDSNRFGQGGRGARLTKLVLFKAGLWGAANFIKTRGRGYNFSEGDGLSYSYSVYDSFGLLSRWADNIIFVPTKKEGHPSWLHPLLNSSHVLVCAVREKNL